jgi:antitoxin component YwqK of YwqJK toxin-antitoxin module
METEIERIYWSNGQFNSEYSHVGGVPHGVLKWWYQSGQLLSEQPYVGGMRHGMSKWWRQNGGIACFCLWNQDEFVARFYPRNETQRWKLK